MNPLDLSNYKGQNPFMPTPTGPTAQVSPFGGSSVPITSLDLSNYQPPDPSPVLGNFVMPQAAGPASVAKPAMGVAAPVYSQPNADGSFSGGAALPPQGSNAYNTAVKAKNFSLYSDTNTYPSNAINTGTTRADVMNYRSGMQNDMMSGANPSLVPTDTNLRDVAKGIYTNSQYTPDEVSLMNSIADNKSKITETSLAERRKIQQLLEDGSISPAQAKAFGQEESRRYDAQLADLTASQSGDTNRLAVLAALRGNNLDAYKNLATFFKPQEVAPGSSLVDQFGNTVAGGTGVSPATAATYASQLFNDDLKTGSQHLTPDGQVDTQFYYQRAQQILGGQMGQGMAGGSTGGTTPGFTGSTGLPAALKPYVIQSQDGTPPYINADRIPTAQADFIKQQAAQNGIPVLSSGDASALQSILYTQENIGKLGVVVNEVLAPGVLGRGQNAAFNAINTLFQNDPRLVAFSQARDTAIKTIQSLVAGTGSGFRLTQPEIDTATSNIPTANDNLETAQAKIKWVNDFINTKKNLILTGTINQAKAQQGSGGLYDF